MARIRTIKPTAFSSDSLSTVSIPARWTFAGLWTYVDDEGRGRGDVRLIKADLYPLDDAVGTKEIEGFLRELESIGAICRYEVEGRRYIHAPRFARHQRINRRTESILPECPRTTHDGLTEDSVSGGGGLTEVVAQEVEVEGKGIGKGSGVVALAQARDDVDRICAHLADRIEGNGSPRPSITDGWRTAARLMLDRDGRDETAVHAAIDWCQDDTFWRANVLSMPKLREKYDQLRLQAQRQQQTTLGRFQDDTDAYFARAFERAAEKDERDSA